MFDGLKETLGRFTDEAADVADEKVEPTDEAPESGGDEVEGPEGEPETDADSRSHAPADAQPASTEEPTDATDRPLLNPTADSDRIYGNHGQETSAETEEDASAGDGAAEAPSAGAETAGASSANAEIEGASSGQASTEEAPTESETAQGRNEGADEAPSFTTRAKTLATGRVILDEDDLEGPLWDLEMALLESDVEMNVAEAILDRIREELVGETKVITGSTTAMIEAALRDALLEVVAVGQFDFDERIAAAEKPVLLVFTGVNGVGKTTSIAKLSRYLSDRGYSTVLANGDTYRAGANEQIKEHANRLDVPLISHEQGGDPAAVIYDAVEYAKANDIDVVLGDTAGRLHTSHDLMAQLEKIDRVVDPDMTLFVDEAVAGQDAVNRAEKFDEAAAIDGSILTMADADAQGGAAISIAYVTGKPILFLGTGQGYDDLERFDPEGLVAELLGE